MPPTALRDPRVSRPTAHVRTAVKRHHLVAIKRANRHAVAFDRAGERLKAAIRRAVAEPVLDANAIRRQFDQLAKALHDRVNDVARADARAAFAVAAVAVNRHLPNPDVPAEMPAALERAILPDRDGRRDVAGAAVVLAPLLTAGLFAAWLAARSGKPHGAGGAGIAVDRLVGRAKSALRHESVRVANAATVAAMSPLSPGVAVPVALPVAIPVAVPIATPIAIPVAVPIATPAAIPLGQPTHPEPFVPTPGASHAQIVPFNVPPDLGDGVAVPVIGWQVLGILDDRIRPAHRERHKTIYYANPKPGQKGYDEMPNPPYEADGSLAHNCRCVVIPVFNDQ